MKNMKKITLVIPDGFDQVISVTVVGVTTAVGVTRESFTVVTSVTTKVYEIENNGLYVLPVKKENENG